MGSAIRQIPSAIEKGLYTEGMKGIFSQCTRSVSLLLFFVENMTHVGAEHVATLLPPLRFTKVAFLHGCC